MNRCSNEFCYFHQVNALYKVDEETRCGLVDIDRYDRVENPEGFNSDTCVAMQRFKRMWYVDRVEARVLRGGGPGRPRKVHKLEISEGGGI